MSAIALEKKVLWTFEDFPNFRRIQEGVQAVIDELPNTRLWIDYTSDLQEGEDSFIQGDWRVSPIYFGLYEDIEAVSGDPAHKRLRPFTDQLPLAFPRTTAVLKNVPEINYAAFSRLPAKSRLDTHSHGDTGSLTFHLGVVIPQGNTCGLEVRGETHLWQAAGDVAIFDGREQHGAWNDSTEDRVVLHVDFVRPPWFDQV